MAEKYLIANVGSASKKYAFYCKNKELAKAHFEKYGGGFLLTYTGKGREQKLKIGKSDYWQSASFFIGLLKKNGFISSASDIRAVGARIVAPGKFFLKPRKIGGEYMRRLHDLKKTDPLHGPGVFLEVKEIKKKLPAAVLIGISDSDFHKNMPAVAKYYALPEKARDLGIERYGYHGISMKFVADEIRRTTGKIPRRMIVCHLGSGSSIGALRNGKSVDTSMGFAPVEGLPMGTRSGDIGAGATIELSKKLKLSPDGLDAYLNKQCGFLGLSGKTSDIRDLLSLERRGDKKAKFALDYFVYHVKKYIGAYAAALGGLDMLVFTATIGERSSVLRKRICGGLLFLGIALDAKKNKGTGAGTFFIEKKKAAVKIAVVPANEMREIFHEAKRLTEGKR